MPTTEEIRSELLDCIAVCDRNLNKPDFGFVKERRQAFQDILAWIDYRPVQPSTETFQEQCDREDAEFNQGFEDIIPEDTPSLEIEGTVFDPSL